MDVLTLPGVFRPRSDSWLLAEAVAAEVRADSRVLDLCTGSGVVGVAAAEAGAAVTSVDVSRRALATVRLNAWRAGVRVRTRRGASFGAVPGERFDVVAANPPYVPAPSERLPRRGPSRAWAAGPDGRRVLDAIVDRVPDHLAPGGRVLLVHSSLIGEEATLDRLRSRGLNGVEVRERHRGPLGPLMREQQAAGLVPDDVEDEEVLLIAAHRGPA